MKEQVTSIEDLRKSQRDAGLKMARNCYWEPWKMTHAG